VARRGYVVSDVILVLAPHPDDEVVGFSALIGRARAAGAAVAVLTLTDGIPPAEVMWPWQRRARPGRVARRLGEAAEVARLLGVEPAGFLDIPSRRLKDNLATASAAVDAVIGRLGVTALWVPAYEGGHQDHDTASFLASRFADRVRVHEAPLYSFGGGRIRCQEFLDSVHGADTIALTEDETAFKRRLLAVYASEQGNLSYVGSGREMLRPQKTNDYALPPHAGRTFYQRFQWVPFRHPRVDFTTPEQVCRALRLMR
jgi:N-acetylglucosamine malate deacetylase 1